MTVLGKVASPAPVSQGTGESCAPQLSQLFEENAAFVWRTLRRLGVAQADLEDATQEVFMVVHKRLDQYEERASIRGWLYAICLRVGSRQRRTIMRRRENVVCEFPEVAVDADQELGVSLRQSLQLGQQLLAALPEKQRMVFMLYEVDHMSMAEIAEVVGCPIQTAYARLHKARERVRVELARARLVGKSR
jgi:RNA polymerase sigma-70 factor (ECF subfamily)